MRLEPVPMYFASHAAEAITMAADSSRTTHQAPEAADACRYFAALLIGALLAVNLGYDADTTGAIDGQIAGAHHGAETIPASWRSKLAMRPRSPHWQTNSTIEPPSDPRCCSCRRRQRSRQASADPRRTSPRELAPRFVPSVSCECAGSVMLISGCSDFSSSHVEELL